MTIGRRLIDAVVRLVRRDRLDRELDDELDAFLDSAIEHHRAVGLTPDAARRAARLEFGSAAAVKDSVHDAGWEAVIGGGVQDIRYALRGMRRAPGSAVILVASLAIGIGANTTIATVANALLRRAPDGVADPDRLVDIAADNGPGPGNPLVSYSAYEEIRRSATTLNGVYAVQGRPETMTLRDPESGTSAPIAALVSTANYFDVLGVRAAVGRVLASDDEDQRVAVLSYDFWSRRLHGDTHVVGRAIQLDDETFTVIGVAASDFHGTIVVAADAWLPLGALPGSRATVFMQPEWGLVGARLTPGASLTAANAELHAISQATATTAPGFVVARSSPIPVTLRIVVVGFLSLLFGITLLVLAVACANVAGVLLAQASARRREIAVRLAIGAGRARLIRQLLTETMILFVIGGSAGLLIARVATTLLLFALPGFAVPVHVSLPLDRDVLVFTAGLSATAAILFGLAPALHGSKTDVAGVLKGESQGPVDRLRLRSVFVVVQIALGLVLVVCAGLLVRALGRTTVLSNGYSTAGVEVETIDLTRAGYTQESGPALARELLARVRALPDVAEASLASSAPGDMRSLLYGITVPDLVPPEGAESFPATLNVVEPGYFRTLGIPFLAGRDFGETDRSGAPGVAIVSRDTAARLWPDRSAIGEHLRLHPLARLDAGAQPPAELTVIGVVGDVDRSGPLVAYLPLEQRYSSALAIVTRSTDGRSVAGAVRSTVENIDPNLVIASSRALDHPTGPVETQLRLAATISSTLGVIALVLAALGIYGVMAYGVSQRTREIGVRVALGARRLDILSLVMGRGSVLIAGGCCGGLLLSAAATRLLRSLLFGLSPLDPLTFVAASLVFVAATLTACGIPAWGALRLNPVDALREG